LSEERSADSGQRVTGTGFAPVPQSMNLPELEERILEFWRRERTFEKLVAKNKGKKRFSFLDGPITANNPMGVHHAWGRTYKDMFQRFKAMQGFDQRYQNGFDCQGLWVEVEVEKELRFNSKRDIEEYGIGRFVEKCKERVRRFSKIQTEQSIRIGQWMDWDHSYYTMSDENNYTIWHFLKCCWNRGLIYRGHDVMPWCGRCGTAISNQEIVTEGYEEMTHAAVYLQFPIRERPGEYLLVWTTTPWTLTSNVAVAVHPEIVYVKVRGHGSGDVGQSRVFYVAKSRLGVMTGSPEVLEELTGDRLVGLTYDGPFDDLPAQKGIVHRVVAWDEVSEADGTGMVHIAPGCGKEDFELGRTEKLPAVAPLDESGVFIDGFDWLTGKPVSEVAQPIFEDLRRKGQLYRVEDYTHRYPVCWRCGSELVFRLVDEWFIRMDELRDEIAEIAKQVRWIPEFGLERELDWLKNMSDWCISKKRYYGLALPIFECECGSFEVIGSRDELKARAVEGWDRFEGNSPHRPWVDEVKIKCPKCGKPVSRVKDVGNPWLDAGIVPYSTTRYLQDRAYWASWFPFDFITESFPGQYRNWFYAILTMSTVLERKAPYRVLLGYAMMRDEKGEEMHKSKGNAIDIEDAVSRMGADVMRWIFASQNPALNLNFGFSLGQDVQRKLLTLWNVYSFFVTYARIDGWKPQGGNSDQVAEGPSGQVKPESLSSTGSLDHSTTGPLSVMDRWIISRLNSLVQTVTGRLEDYDPSPVPKEIERFIDDLSVWYVRRCRRRFWKSSEDQDKLAAYQTLYESLVTLAKLVAPIMPFLSEALYQNLVVTQDDSAPRSVHLCEYPTTRTTARDEKLETEMALVRKLVSLGHAAREKSKTKVRQPLAAAFIKLATGHEYGMLDAYKDVIREELNVKRVEYAVGGHERAVLESPHYVSETDSNHLVAVDTQLSDELRHEGLARELVRRVQNLRKEAGFDVADRITLNYQAGAGMEKAIQAFGDYIRQEVLAVKMTSGGTESGEAKKEFKISGETVGVALTRTGKP
jgi:isoleucyl-tRNA synthetase